jgi:hypothetical protein
MRPGLSNGMSRILSCCMCRSYLSTLPPRSTIRAGRSLRRKKVRCRGTFHSVVSAATKGLAYLCIEDLAAALVDPKILLDERPVFLRQQAVREANQAVRRRHCGVAGGCRGGWGGGGRRGRRNASPGDPTAQLYENGEQRAPSCPCAIWCGSAEGRLCRAFFHYALAFRGPSRLVRVIYGRPLSAGYTQVRTTDERARDKTCNVWEDTMMEGRKWCFVVHQTHRYLQMFPVYVHGPESRRIDSYNTITR